MSLTRIINRPIRKHDRRQHGISRRPRMETLESRALLAATPWNEVTEIAVPTGLSSVGTVGEWRIVAMDGDNLVVGVRSNDQAATDAGAAYVFRWDGADCVQEAKLLASDAGPNDQFGFAVSLTNDRALVGAHESGGSMGAAYVYRRNGTMWVQEMKLVGSDTAAGDELGFSVALSEVRAVVGARIVAHALR